LEIEAHIIVKGLVQGVGYRYFASSRASRIGVKGFARNLANGDVEIVASAGRSLIEEFIKELKIGPRAAQVNDLVIDWRPPNDRYNTFEIR